MSISEWITYGEVEGVVATPSGMDQWPRFSVHCRIVGLHSEVEPDKEVVEVHSESDAVAGCEFLIE